MNIKLRALVAFVKEVAVIMTFIMILGLVVTVWSIYPLICNRILAGIMLCAILYGGYRWKLNDLQEQEWRKAHPGQDPDDDFPDDDDFLDYEEPKFTISMVIRKPLDRPVIMLHEHRGGKFKQFKELSDGEIQQMRDAISQYDATKK